MPSFDFESRLTSSGAVVAFAKKILNGAATQEEREALKTALLAGMDPLGDAYMKVNSPEQRRGGGETYTPRQIVDEMVSEAKRRILPEAIVDCGCGSGRYAIACAKAFPEAKIYALDLNDKAILMAKANAAAAGLADRIHCQCQDFLTADFSELPRPVLWIGNPPYVRHHEITPAQKEWFRETTASFGIQGSALAGLHLYFLAAMAKASRPGDFGILVTSAEWLDVNYGRVVRRMLADGPLSLVSLHLHDRRTQVFEGTNTTAVVFSFGAGNAPSDNVWISDGEMSGRMVSRTALRAADRWSPMVSAPMHTEKSTASGLVPLGTFVRVHRGMVTGNNKFWVRSKDELKDVPPALTVPVISHARELTGDCVAQKSPECLKRLIVLPEDLSELTGKSADAAGEIIEEGLSQGVNQGYIAQHRRRWWSVRPPAEVPPVLMTYMGRRRPSFVINSRRLPMLNVVHGLYPKVPLSDAAMQRLVNYLNEHVTLEDGRMYAGGLVKFEPKEAEAIMVPPVSVLEAR